MTRWSAMDKVGGNGMKIGLDWDIPSVSNSTTSITIPFTASTGNLYRYDDNGQTVVWTGDITGTNTYNNIQGAGTETVRATRSLTYTYPSNSYGSSPANRTVNVRVGYSYNGSHPSLSVTIAIPARPYAKPNAPSNMVAGRTSDTKATVSWTKNATDGKPYTSVTIQRRIDNSVTGEVGPWSTVATVPGSATSWTDNGIAANQYIQYQVRANNTAGSSGWASGDGIRTSPAAPSSVKAAVQSGGASIKITYKINKPYAAGGQDIERQVNGGAWAFVANVNDTGTWTDTSPGAGTNRYRLRENVVSQGQQLWSAWAESNTVSTIVPPLAPTLLKPNGAIFDPIADGGVVITWQHNDGGDGAEQTKFQARKSNDGGATWGTSAIYDSTVSQHTLGSWTNGATYLWQVRTWGAHADPSPWSASATIITSTTPTVTIDDIGDFGIVTTMPTVVTWSFNQDEGLTQTAWEARLYDEAAPDDVLATGSGTTQTSWTTTYPLQDDHAYFVRVRARANTLWSNWAESYFIVDLLPPANVTVTPSFDPGTGWMVLDLHADDPAPDGTAIRTNRHPNPFATGLTGWTVTGRAVTTTAVIGIPGTMPRGLRATMSDSATSHPNIWTSPLGLMTVTPGETLPLSVEVLRTTVGAIQAQFEWRDGAGAVTYSPTDWRQLAAYEVATITASHVVPATAVSARVVVTAWGPTLGAGEEFIVGGVMVGATGTPFDGDTADTEEDVYAWTGTPRASASTESTHGTNAIDHVAIQRRIEGGGWVTIYDDIEFLEGPDTTALDTVPSLNARHEYRLVITSISPSTAVTEPVEFTTRGWLSTPWSFLSRGEGFTQIVRMAGNLRLSDKPELATAAKPAAGRRKPLLLVGRQQSRSRSVQGRLVWEDTPGTDGPSSTDHEWIAAGLEAGLVCWRDPRGVRMFGRLSSGIQVDPLPDDMSADVSFSVEETDYDEGVA